MSEDETLTFFILNQEDQEPTADLLFYASSHSGHGSNSDAYHHNSTYDEETGEYGITLPSHINTDVTAELDLNNDGAPEWKPVSVGGLYGTQLNLTPEDIASQGTLYLQRPDADWHTLELRVSVLDADLNPMGDSLALSIQDDINDDVANSEAVSTAPFAIGDMHLDNNNYTHNGTASKTENSAGEATSPSDLDRNVHVMLPLTAANLEDFVLATAVVVSDGNTEYFNNAYTVVEDGEFNYSSNRAYVYSTAQ